MISDFIPIHFFLIQFSVKYIEKDIDSNAASGSINDSEGQIPEKIIDDNKPNEMLLDQQEDIKVNE